MPFMVPAVNESAGARTVTPVGPVTATVNGTLAGGSNLTINSGGRVLGNVTDALGYYNGGSPTSVNNS